MRKIFALFIVLAVFMLSACGSATSQDVTDLSQTDSTAESLNDGVNQDESMAPDISNADEEQDVSGLSAGSSGVLICDALRAIESPPVNYEISLLGDIETNLTYLEKNLPRVAEVNTLFEAEKDSLTSDEKVQFLTLSLGLNLLERAMDRWERGLTGAESGEYSNDLITVDEFGFAVKEQVDTVKSYCL